jgi:cytochrome c peroxidase
MMAPVLQAQQAVIAWTAMPARRSWWAFALALAGCGETMIDGRFTGAEWDFLQTFRLPPPPTTDGELWWFGQTMFFDASYAGPLAVSSDLGEAGEEGRVSCASCHVPRAWFSDDRSPGGTSLGADWTKRNAPTLVNVGYQKIFTWDGRFATLEEVIEAPLEGDALLNSDPARLAAVVCTTHRARYEAAFGVQPTDCAQRADQIVADVGAALAEYERMLRSANSPFDRYLDGDFAALDDAAKRGLELFIGPALCSECHHGPLLADGGFHVTGVAQRGPHVPAEDLGRGDGSFRTPGLRHVAETAPYMHTGELETLADVIELYRWGGEDAGFAGTKDRMMQPLDLTPRNAADLVAFLEALTGDEVPAVLLESPRP